MSLRGAVCKKDTCIRRQLDVGTDHRVPMEKDGLRIAKEGLFLGAQRNGSGIMRQKAPEGFVADCFAALMNNNPNAMRRALLFLSDL